MNATIPQHKKQIIGHDILSEKAYNEQIIKKKKAWSNIWFYMEKFGVDLSEEEYKHLDFSTSEVKNELVHIVKEKNKSKNLDIKITDNKLLELIGFDAHYLHSLIFEFVTIDVDFNNDTKEPIERDFKIYAETLEEKQEYLSLQKLCDELNRCKAYMIPGAVAKQQICQYFRTVIRYDFRTDEIIPNERFIKRKKE